MFVSSGRRYPEILKQHISQEFPVHTFAMGYHYPREMMYIADMTSGTYSYIDLDTNDIKYALKIFLTGITSVVAKSIKIDIQAHDGITLFSIESGRYKKFISSDKGSGTIHLSNIYAGEQKDFIIYLIVPQDKETLMTVGGRYQSLNAIKDLVGMEVTVLRPLERSLPEELVIHPKVAAELLRIEYKKHILAVQNQDVSGDKLKMLWDITKDSGEGRAIPKETLSDLDKDVAEIHKGNKQYMMSWLSCHEWQHATNKGKPSNSSAFQMIGQQHGDGDTISVKIEGFTRSKAIMGTEMCNEFPVLVRVMVAPWRRAEEMPRAGIDIVAIVDISKRMHEERMERVKKAMMIIIDKLGPSDRLSILSLHTHKLNLMELTYMSNDQGHGRDAARLKISELKASNGRDVNHITCGTLLDGAKILRSRGAESSNRVGCMLLLSDNEYPETIADPKFPVHTFGLGDNHNPKGLKYIADVTSGTYSFMNQEISNIKDALMLFITGITSIAASSVNITLKACFGVTISSINSSGYIHHVKPNKMSGKITIDHIYAGEQKDFIVNLEVGNGWKELMTIGGHYQSFSGSKPLAAIDISVLQPWRTCSPDELSINRDVAAELMRSRLRNSISAMLELQHLTGQELQKLWDMIKDSDEGRGAPKESLSQLSMDVTEMNRNIENPEEYRKSGLPYMLSWLSSHMWQRATTKGAHKNSSAFETIGQHTDGDTNLLKLETITRSNVIASDEQRNKFPVLVRVTVAPWQHAEKMPHAGIDIVAVLDVSGGMQGHKLEYTKQAMMVIIDKLSVDDRLSIVSFNTYEQRLTKLTYMSEHGQNIARLQIKKLVASGKKDMGAALREGAQILWWRGAECSHRLGCMMLLSDGEYPEIFKTELKPVFPVHTFGLGTDHNPNVMKYIADMTSGTYSFISQDIDRTKDALALFITGLTSVAAMSIKITLRTGEGVTISSIESGGYINHVKSDDRSGTIDIHNIYANERKDFIVYLRVADGKELMTIGGRYLSHTTVKHLAYTDVYVPRAHQEYLPDDLAMLPDVAAELVRIRLMKGISAMLENGPSTIELQQLWDGIIDSDEGRGASEETLSGFSMDISEMKRDIENPKKYRRSGLPYTLSWLSSHKWQRATTKGTPSSFGGFQTIRQDAYERTTLLHQPK